MISPFIIAPAVALLIGLLHFEGQRNKAGKLLTKTPCSLLFVLAALLAPKSAVPSYSLFIVFGLCFSLGGDVLLALEGRKTFLLGLVSFLIGHICYVLAFMKLTAPGSWINIGLPVVVLVSLVVFFYFKPHLGDMIWPVSAYIVVITIMAAGALAVLNQQDLARPGRLLVACGAILFYLSDLFVARDRFLKDSMVNRYIGLPLYYGGQFLLAFSISAL